MFNRTINFIISIFRKPKPTLVVRKVREVDLMADVDKRDMELYLAGPSAFWLNPNRYQADGTYDLLADPYVAPVVVETPRTPNLGKWTKTEQIPYNYDYNKLLKKYNVKNINSLNTMLT